MKNKTSTTSPQGGIQDSKKDQKQLQPEEITMDLPEVKDIPGQEHVHPPQMKEFADVTISSDDEEGKNIEGFNDDEEDETDEQSDVSKEEKDLLEQSVDSMGSEDDKDRAKATLDNVDDDGEPLNEGVDASGSDLDVPGSEEDDEDEEAGAEDEENNSYSLGADKKD